MGRIGRPPLGETRKVSITLPKNAWADLEHVHLVGPDGVETPERRSMSAIMRHVVLSYLYGNALDEEL